MFLLILESSPSTDRSHSGATSTSSTSILTTFLLSPPSLVPFVFIEAASESISSSPMMFTPIVMPYLQKKHVYGRGAFRRISRTSTKIIISALGSGGAYSLSAQSYWHWHLRKRLIWTDKGLSCTNTWTTLSEEIECRKSYSKFDNKPPGNV